MRGMKKIPKVASDCHIVLACCVLLTSCMVKRPASDVDRAPAAAKAVEQQRLALTVAGNLVALRPLLSDKLIYCHSSALCESGASMLGRLHTGELKYLKLDPVEMQAEQVAGAVVMRGILDARVQNAGQSTAARLRYLAVYENTASGWQLRAYQSTRMP
jgi:hypothetical protein